MVRPPVHSGTWAERTNLVRVQPTNQPPQPAAVPPAQGKPRNRRLRLLLAMGAGILALLCLGGIGVAISLYDEATKIERTQPDVVVSSFLRSYLVNRSDEEAALYTCNSGGNLGSIASLRTELVNREQEFDVVVNVNWGTLTVSGSGDGRRSVSTDLTIAGTSEGQQISKRTEAWAFSVVDEDGWRVCDATKMS